MFTKRNFFFFFLLLHLKLLAFQQLPVQNIKGTITDKPIKTILAGASIELIYLIQTILLKLVLLAAAYLY